MARKRKSDDKNNSPNLSDIGDSNGNHYDRCYHDGLQPDPILENIVGELAIPEFQSSRLKSKLSNKVAGYIHLSGCYYKSTDKGKESWVTFYHNKKYYKISLRVEELSKYTINNNLEVVYSYTALGNDSKNKNIDFADK